MVAAEDEPVTQSCRKHTIIAAMLATALRATPVGNDHATAYHRLMIGVMEFLFYPALLHPRKEKDIHEGRKRIDILMENGAVAGPFFTLSTIKRLPCAYVAIECKNYGGEVANPELDQLAGRFSTNRGRLGLLCCRKFQDRALFVKRCRDTLKDDRGLIIPLDDETILRLLEHVELGRRGLIEKDVTDLIDEIWIA